MFIEYIFQGLILFLITIYKIGKNYILIHSGYLDML